VTDSFGVKLTQKCQQMTALSQTYISSFRPEVMTYTSVNKYQLSKLSFNKWVYKIHPSVFIKKLL